MKRATPFITISSLVVALFLVVGSTLVRASEITGTISTAGSTSDTSGDHTPIPTPSPSSTPSPDSATSTDTGHASHVEDRTIIGVVENGAPANPAPENHYVYVYSYPTPSETQNTPSENASATTSSDSATSTAVATSTPETSDISREELAHLASMNFGPRFGMPGYPYAPYAGGPIGESRGMEDVGADISQSLATPEPTPVYVARAGQGIVKENNTDITANALTSAAGLSMPQLLLIATLGLLLLGSMGYAISRTGGTATPL